jgi:Secretion system C-terminal sorting domain
MNKLIIFIGLLCFSKTLHSQNKYDYIWHTGYSFFRGPAPNNAPLYGFQLNFNNGKVKIDTMKRNYDFLETVQSTCDSNGNFLFSSNGCKIFNKKFEVMDNGDDLNQVPQSTFSNSCIETFSKAEIIHNGALSLPLPNSKDSIFVFFRNEINKVIFGRQNLLPLNLYYSTINMNANNGLGKVVVKNQIIVRDTMDSGDINAVKHANGKDWWVITRKFISDTFFTFRLSSNGLDSSFKQAIGLPTTDGGQGGGDASFAPNGLKYAYFTARRDQLMLYDFNRSTGKLANFKRIIIPYELDPSSVFFSGTAFSASSKFLYIFTSTQIFQVDTDVNDIQSNVLEVARYDTLAARFAFPTGGRLAPDCKIYFTSTNGLPYFGYIRYPDRKGVACQVMQGAIKTPFTSAIRSGLPNNPNYRLGVIPTHPCDSTIDFRVPTKETFTKIDVNVFPNPSTGNVTLDWDDGINTEGGIIRVFNMLGQMVFQQTIPSVDTRAQLELNVPSGVYHIRMNFKENKVFQGRVLIAK